MKIKVIMSNKEIEGIKGLIEKVGCDNTYIDILDRKITYEMGPIDINYKKLEDCCECDVSLNDKFSLFVLKYIKKVVDPVKSIFKIVVSMFDGFEDFFDGDTICNIDDKPVDEYLKEKSENNDLKSKE